MARWIVVGALVVAAVVAGCTSGGESADPTTTSTTRFQPPIVSSTAPSTTTTQPTTTSTTTTTLPGPPHLEVLDPAHGATVTSARYTFTGVTDPGCTVTVGGRYEAAVGEDGSWSLDLMLELGRNSTTFNATHPETGLETSQAIRVYYAEPVELRADGLGAVSFDDDEATTMAILTELLGPPVMGSTCIHDVECTGMGYGWCTYIQTARWPDHGLSVVIADCESPDPPPHTPTLIGWSAGHQSTLRTPEGVGPGSTLGELVAVYGERLVVLVEECGWGLEFAIAGPDGVEYGGLRGGLHEPPGLDLEKYQLDSEQLLELLDPSTKVTALGAGVRQSC